MTNSAASDFPFRDPSLDLESRLSDLLSRLTLEEKIGLIPTMQCVVPRLGMLEYHIGAEGAHGFVDREGPSTTFPQTLALSSTWDKELLEKIGEVIGTEARVYFNRGNKGGLSLWFPTIDMERDPRWGRTEEAYGEDPFLAGSLAAAVIRGTQGDDPFYVRASCAPKHFFANNNEKNRVSCSCSIDPRCMREYYLAAFQPAFRDGKAFSLMTAYNEVNGIPLMCHPAVREIVKGEWGLEGRGHVVTDGGDVSQTVDLHRYFASHAETVAAGFKAGIDSMTDSPKMVIQAVNEALARGLIDEAELDTHVANTLRLRFRFGHFDPPGNCPYDALSEDSMMTAESAKLSRTAASEAVVLLKNAIRADGTTLLPLAPGKTVAVIGPLSDISYADWYTGKAPYSVTPLDGLVNVLGKDAVVHEDGRDIVAFYTAEGFPLVLDSDSVLTVSADPSAEASRFLREDWGWGANTLWSADTGKYLETLSALDAQKQPGAEDLANQGAHPVSKAVRATASTTLNWFITTLFNIIPDARGENATLLRSWDGRTIQASGSGPVRAETECDFPESFAMKVIKDGKKAAREAAMRADVALVFAGNNPVINGKEEMDRPDIVLPPFQSALVREVKAANANTGLVLVSSYPIAVTEEEPLLDAIVWTAHGMQEGGNALADVLTGNISPAGRLSMTWYRSVNDLPDMMDYDIINSGATYQYFAGTPLFPFGHGLSYSRFTYAALSLSGSYVDADSPVEVSFTVTNEGAVDADEVAQLYVSVLLSRVKRPIRTLKGFQRVRLASGESRRLSFILRAEDLAVWDVTRERFCVEQGECDILAGASSSDIRLTARIAVHGEVIPPRACANVNAWNWDGQKGLFLHERRGSGIPAAFSAGGEAWAFYRSMDLGRGVSWFEALIRAESGAVLEVRVNGPDGPLVGRLCLPNTGDNCEVPDFTGHLVPASIGHMVSGMSARAAWTGIRMPLSPLTGIQDVYILLRGRAGIQSFSFT